MSFYPTLEEHPFWYVYGFLLVVVFCRAQATYWIARGARSGIGFTKLAKYENSPRMDKARRQIDRWGPPAIAVSFLTVGFQTIMNAYAGFIRMNIIRYTVAMFFGCLAWALIYTLGAAVVVNWIQLAFNSPWTAAVIGLAVAALVAFLVLRRRHKRASGIDEANQSTGEPA